MPKVVLYFAPECHLCAAARRTVAKVRAETPFELDEIDITGEPGLEARYRERIPVVEVDGDEAFTFYVHPDGLKRRLGVL